MKKKKAILTPKMPVEAIFKMMAEDKKKIQKAIKEGRESELTDKSKFKFVRSV